MSAIANNAEKNRTAPSWTIRLLIGVIICLSIGCDQGSKQVARNELAPKQWVEVVPSVFSLTNVENTGAFLGLGSELGSLRPLVMIWVPSLVLLGLLGYIMMEKTMPKNQRYILALIAGGGFGNLIDRIRFGSVTDFLHLDFALFQTGIFNVADLLITTGMVVLLWISFRAKK